MAATSNRLLAKREAELTDDERELVKTWGGEAFGPQEWLRAFHWSPPDWRLLLLESGVPVSHVKLTVRRGRIENEEVLFTGVGGVMTPRIYQGKGFSTTLLQLTSEFIFTNLRADYGLLFCLPSLTPFYARLGWITVQSPVVIEQPQGKIVWPQAAMVLPPDGEWQDAPIDVCGKPW